MKFRLGTKIYHIDKKNYIIKEKSLKNTIIVAFRVFFSMLLYYLRKFF